jgi:AraC-like DNA-binding protein
MGISVRTLQRRLGEEGGSYSSVLDGLRRDVAGELLGKGSQSAADIAFLLGYSEPSAFHRAVRRWQNIPPASGMN